MTMKTTHYLEIWLLLGPVEYIDPPDYSTPILVVVYKEGVGKVPANAWYTYGQPTHMDFSHSSAQHWQRLDGNRNKPSSQWAKGIAVWLVITHDP